MQNNKLSPKFVYQLWPSEKCFLLRYKKKENIKEGCHAELVEAWWAGLYTRVFDRLRLTGPFLIKHVMDNEL
jgi:hypothetical protein